jgi:hypothetical protein
MVGPRQVLAQLDDSVNVPVKRMFSIGPIKALETIRSGGDQSKRAELAQFVLDGVKGKMRFEH